MRWLPVLLLITMMMAAPCQADPYAKYNRIKKFDRHFSKYSKRYFGPGFDWRLFKAQAVAESGLDAAAKSGVGAVGLMQVMPRTFKEIQAKNPAIKGKQLQPRWNIAAGIYYDRTLWKLWRAERPRQDRLNFMFGSYNAGKGNILKAQRTAEELRLNPNLWESIITTLSNITGKRSLETISYVEKIEHIKGVLK
jgi:membrane-bound lytic murein transglycosylase MltF